jgi:hypothetical protein
LITTSAPIVGHGLRATVTGITLLIREAIKTPMQEIQIKDTLANPWTPWEHLADDPEDLVFAMDAALRNSNLPASAYRTVVEAVERFTSPNRGEQRRTRARIAYFLVNSYKAI